MKVNLEINNQAKCPLSDKYFKKVVSETIKLSQAKIAKEFNASLAIVSEKEIKKINRIYRKKNKITDILSFSDFPGKSKKKVSDAFCELIVCYAYVKKSAKEQDIALKKEMAYVISHGILHCLGWKHSEKMYDAQDKVCKIFNI
jgi:probable rRNA maturation factor